MCHRKMEEPSGGRDSSGAHLSPWCLWLSAGLFYKVQLNNFVQGRQPQVSKITSLSYGSKIWIKLTDPWFSCILMEIFYLCCQECHDSYLESKRKIWSILSPSLSLQHNWTRIPHGAPSGVCSSVSLTQNDLICYGCWELRGIKSRVCS